ncbi:MAG: cytochrome c [Dehalococcoidia bacterium]|nr:cytochrome c [Dehalococcoidia bacterium]
MTPRVLARLAPLLALAAVALLAACGGSDGDATPVVTFEGTDGASLFAQACAGCHGEDLTGTDQGPPFLHAFYVPGHHGDAAFFLAAQRGVRSHHWNFGDMPPVEGITQEQVTAIVAFVREQQRAAGIE